MCEREGQGEREKRRQERETRRERKKILRSKERSSSTGKCSRNMKVQRYSKSKNVFKRSYQLADY